MSLVKRMRPNRSDLGATILGGSLPLLMGATPAGAPWDVLGPILLAAAGALGGVVGKSVAVFLWSLARSYGRRMLSDKDPGNDALGQALVDAADRQDPEGRLNAGGEVTPTALPAGRAPRRLDRPEDPTDERPPS